MSGDPDYEISANITHKSLTIMSTSEKTGDGDYVKFVLYGKELYEIERALSVLRLNNKSTNRPSL